MQIYTQPITSRGAQSRTDISPKPSAILISPRIFKTKKLNFQDYVTIYIYPFIFINTIHTHTLLLCMCVCMCIITYTHTHVPALAHTHTHTHSQTCIRICYVYLWTCQNEHNTSTHALMYGCVVISVKHTRCSHAYISHITLLNVRFPNHILVRLSHSYRYF